MGAENPANPHNFRHCFFKDTKRNTRQHEIENPVLLKGLYSLIVYSIKIKLEIGVFLEKNHFFPPFLRRTIEQFHRSDGEQYNCC